MGSTTWGKVIMPTQLEARPPYVIFEMRPEEDRAASQAKGHAVYKDVAYVIVTPQGSKDRYERVASEWFEQKQLEANEGRFPAEWLQHYRNQFQLWQQGQEVPLDGTSILNWPVATKAQVKTLIGIGVRTVEDLALANEETLARIGMGSRSLQAQARAYLENAKDSGVVVKQVTALQEENAQLKLALAKQAEQIDLLLARIPETEAPAQQQESHPPMLPQRGGIQASDFLDATPPAAELRKL